MADAETGLGFRLSDAKLVVVGKKWRRVKRKLAD
jgi:hypothetical protein